MREGGQDRVPTKGGYLLTQKLSRVERAHVRLMNWVLDTPWVDRLMCWCQRNLGSRWIAAISHGRLHVLGMERFPELKAGQGYVIAANHLSYFDLWVVCGAIARRRGLRHRILFPVRSNFFYDNPLGMVINGITTYFAIYPPLFRDRKRMAANLASLDEMVHLVSTRDVLLGIHPEGTRNKTGDPYTLLPVQAGIGRIVHRARVPVLPVFLRGPSNSLWRELWGTLTGKGQPWFLAFGAPVPLDDLLEARGTATTYSEIAARTMAAITALSQEERAARAAQGFPEGQEPGDNAKVIN